MATWHEIGQDNFRAGRELFDRKRYRSCVSRFYYAAFSVLTHELILAGAGFGDQQETPNHKGLPKLVRLHLAINDGPKSECISIIRRLYAARIVADYQRRTINENISRGVMRDAANLFRQFGVEHD